MTAVDIVATLLIVGVLYLDVAARRQERRDTSFGAVVFAAIAYGLVLAAVWTG